MLVLSEKDLGELQAYLDEVPLKYAAPIVQFFMRKHKELADATAEQQKLKEMKNEGAVGKSAKPPSNGVGGGKPEKSKQLDPR